ncbi:hypothetical protein ACE1B6_15580 [Aerosakkonemataceae cyanobacterium BLCC-F154]|uniref:Uncharacterized protein n=1 Tax=Floridaenema fluviatile BLCC-F154 TaxID=3153640 RepID=A0ABV4YD40_9CYAN
MKLNYFTKVARKIATVLFCVCAIAFTWQGAFLTNSAAIAAPATNLIAAADNPTEFAEGHKSFVRDAADKVKETANENARKVDRATDNGSFVERKAKSDRDFIEKRANEDAERTQEAIDKSTNVFERTVEGIKDAFGG